MHVYANNKRRAIRKSQRLGLLNLWARLGTARRGMSCHEARLRLLASLSHLSYQSRSVSQKKQDMTKGFLVGGPLAEQFLGSSLPFATLQSLLTLSSSLLLAAETVGGNITLLIYVSIYPAGHGSPQQRSRVCLKREHHV